MRNNNNNTPQNSIIQQQQQSLSTSLDESSKRNELFESVDEVLTKINGKSQEMLLLTTNLAKQLDIEIQKNENDSILLKKEALQQFKSLFTDASNANQYTTKHISVANLMQNVQRGIQIGNQQQQQSSSSSSSQQQSILPLPGLTPYKIQHTQPITSQISVPLNSGLNSNNSYMNPSVFAPSSSSSSQLSSFNSSYTNTNQFPTASIPNYAPVPQASSFQLQLQQQLNQLKQSQFQPKPQQLQQTQVSLQSYQTPFTNTLTNLGLGVNSGIIPHTQNSIPQQYTNQFSSNSQSIINTILNTQGLEDVDLQIKPRKRTREDVQKELEQSQQDILDEEKEKENEQNKDNQNDEDSDDIDIEELRTIVRHASGHQSKHNSSAVNNMFNTNSINSVSSNLMNNNNTNSNNNSSNNNSSSSSSSSSSSNTTIDLDSDIDDDGGIYSPSRIGSPPESNNNSNNINNNINNNNINNNNNIISNNIISNNNISQINQIQQPISQPVSQIPTNETFSSNLLSMLGMLKDEHDAVMKQ